MILTLIRSSPVNMGYIGASNGCLRVGPGQGKFHRDILQSGLKINIWQGVRDWGVSSRVELDLGIEKNMPRSSLVVLLKLLYSHIIIVQDI